MLMFSHHLTEGKGKKLVSLSLSKMRMGETACLVYSVLIIHLRTKQTKKHISPDISQHMTALQSTTFFCFFLVYTSKVVLEISAYISHTKGIKLGFKHTQIQNQKPGKFAL